jgi:hypothetical protein
MVGNLVEQLESKHNMNSITDKYETNCGSQLKNVS